MKKRILSLLLALFLLVSLVACEDELNFPTPPDDGETPDEGGAPEDGETSDKGETPDEGGAPEDGETSDKGETPDEGGAPEDGNIPNEGETPDDGENPDEGETPEEEEPSNDNELIDGNWAGLDFKGATLTVSVSCNQSQQALFGAADKYTRGPDGNTSDPVQRKVLARNKKVAEDLDINLEYQLTDWNYSEILPHLEQLVSGDAEDAPDVYNNDVYAMVDAMLNGYLHNVTDPGVDVAGNEIKSYFDFANECWYQTYMEGASFSKDKLYILAGKYNIDLIRNAWVFFVNIDLWDATFYSLPEEDWGYNTYESFCSWIKDTEEWFYDDLIMLAAIAHNDAGGSTHGKTDKNDAQIGVCMNNLAQRVMIWGSGVSVYEWSKNGKACDPGEGTPSLIAQNDIDAMVQLGNKYTELYNARGVLPLPDSVLDCTIEFMDGRIVMSMALLGEMESPQMRATSFERGVLPFPRFARDQELNTVIHDQAEIDTILGNTENFAIASAFLQYVNEQSADVWEEYYEVSLKFKYTGSPGARDMIDMVHDNIASPFDSVLSAKVFSEKQFYVSFQSDATANRDSTFSSTYAESREAVQKTLEDMLLKFEAMP